MSDIPKLKKRSERTPINIVLDTKVHELYVEAKQNGWNSSEIARQAVTDKFLSIADKVKKPAS